MALAGHVALILSRALNSMLLKPRSHGEDGDEPHRFPLLRDLFERAKHGFNTRFERASASYSGSVAKVVDRKWLFLAIYALAVALPRSEERRGGKECVRTWRSRWSPNH